MVKHTRFKRWAVAAMLVGVLGLGSAAQAAISYQGTAGRIYGGYSYYTQPASDYECYMYYSSGATWHAPWSSGWEMAGGSWIDPGYQGICEWTEYSSPSYTNTSSGDIMVFINRGTPDTPAGALQQYIFNGAAGHAAACTSGSGYCYRVWENFAPVPDPKWYAPYDSTRDLLVAGIGGTDYYTIDGNARSGTRYVFRESDSARRSSFYSRASAVSGKKKKYLIAGYSDELSYSQCASAIGDAYNLTYDEGRNSFSGSYSYVSSVVGGLRNTLANYLKDDLGWVQRLAINEWKMANVVLNVFLNNPGRFKDDPVGRTISGVTAPVLLEVYLRPENAPPPRCVPYTCASLGVSCGSYGNGCGGTLNCGSCEPDPLCVSKPTLCQMQ